MFLEAPIAHFLLGTRYDESNARAKTMRENSGLSSEIHPHGTIPTSGVIRPIEDWDAGMVWDLLLKENWTGGGRNPFFEINQKLAILYKDAASGECPVIHDPSQQTCAGSRFGCWTCTVVEVDSSLREMIGSGRDGYKVEDLELLADFRDDLQDQRNKPENRVHGRNRRGRVLVKRDGSVGVGPYTMDYRRELLDRLTQMQERIGSQLISPEEEVQIRMIWAEETADLVQMIQTKVGSN